MLFAHASSNKNGVRDILGTRVSGALSWSDRRYVETRLDHVIKRSVTITILLLGRDILKKKKNKNNNKKEKCDFLKTFFLWIF